MKLSFLHSASALLILYLIQGIFVGFTFGVKLLVQQHNATEAQQGILSWANYPFSFKVSIIYFIEYFCWFRARYGKVINKF